MDLNFTDDEQAFRAEVRQWVAEHLPADISAKVHAALRLTRDDLQRWAKILGAKGWLGWGWPTAFGGPGWNAIQRHLFEEECALAGAPRVIPFGPVMVAPVIMAFGNAAQQARFLPGIASGEVWWSQGYSEPGSGSDLASVKTRAERVGDHYVVNGQKTWTTLGQYGDWIFCLVRTSTTGKPQTGISFLLIDMTSPGIEVRPIITLDGAHEVNEVFLTDVRVPVENLVGVENRGWDCAKYLLTYERTNIAGVGFSTAALARLKDVAARVRRNGRPLIEDPLFATRLARVEIDLENMKTTNLRVIAAVAGGGAPGAESSMLKIRGTVIRQEITALLRRAMGPQARPFVADVLEGHVDEAARAGLPGPAEAATAAASYFNNRKLSIFGGSNEIQRNIISKMILGL